MKNKTTPTPSISFNKQSLNTFDLLLDKFLGYKYEGTLFDNLWIYRKSSTETITIQVGNGGVMFVSIDKTDENGKSYPNFINITELKNVAELYKEIEKYIKIILAVSK